MSELMRAASRLAIVSMIGGFAAACSSDSMRFAENPLSNPFGAQKGEPATTGSIGEPSVAMPRSQVSSAPLAPVQTASIPAPTTTSSLPARMTSSGPAGWSTEGGTPVIVAPGETLSTLSTRYGVPETAILSSNGMSAGDVRPGRRVTIPIYSATGVAAPARVVQAPPRAEPAPSHGQVLATARLPERPKAEPVRMVETRPERMEPKTHPRPGRVVQAAEPARVAKVEERREVARAEPKVLKPEPKHEAKPVAKAEVKTLPKVEAKAEPKVAKAEPAKVAKVEPKKVEPKVAAQSELLPSRSTKSEPVKVARVEPAPVAAPEPAPAPAAKEPESTGAVQSGGDFRWPARGRVISGFGNAGSNEGINIAVPDGTPVKAAGDGVVAYAGSEVKGYGNLVLIRHENGYVSAYAHNGEVDVKRGQKVARGQTIAKSGQSGNVTSPQLHFEIRKGATPVDPMKYLASN